MPLFLGGVTSFIQIGTADKIMNAPAPEKNRNTMNMATCTLPASNAPEISVISALTPMAALRPHLSANQLTVKTPRKPPTW